MARAGMLTRKNVMLEEEKVRQLVKHLNASSESEAIRTVIDDRLFADEVMKHVLQLRRRGTVQDASKRTTGKYQTWRAVAPYCLTRLSSFR